MYLVFCGVFFSCANDLVDTSKLNGPVNWQLFDSALYTSDLVAADGNILFFAGEYGNCFKIQNGVKTYYDFRFQNFNANVTRYFNGDIFAFGSVNVQPDYFYYYYYDTSAIKFIEGSTVKTFTFPNRYYGRDLFDFIFLDSDKLLISSVDSIYIKQSSGSKRLKGTGSGANTYFHNQNGSIYIIYFNRHERYVRSDKIVSDSIVRYSTTTSADNLWLNCIKDKAVKEFRLPDGKCRLSYLSSNGWTDFFTTDAKYFQSITGDDINNFYFSARDTSGKIIRKYFNGNELKEDTFFGQDSIQTGRNPMNGEIFAWKTIRATGVSYIYRGKIR